MHASSNRTVGAFGAGSLGKSDAHTVTMGDLGVVAAPGTVVTYALGSCIAVCVHDAGNRIAGMIHYVLPESAVDKKRSRTQPAMFADTGLPALMSELTAKGANRKGLVAKVVGGAAVPGAPQIFNVGKRSVLAAKKLLWQLNLRIVASEVGGSISRTVRIDAVTGLVRITTPGMDARELR